MLLRQCIGSNAAAIRHTKLPVAGFAIFANIRTGYNKVSAGILKHILL